MGAHFVSKIDLSLRIVLSSLPFGLRKKSVASFRFFLVSLCVRAPEERRHSSIGLGVGFL